MFRSVADVVGADELDEYGGWRTTPEYGAVWVPAVAPGWAPYHYGHWVWVEPWGWTWVDDAPWGYAPCHYGRWVHYEGFWGWAPGPVGRAIMPKPAKVGSDYDARLPNVFRRRAAGLDWSGLRVLM